MSGSRKIDVGVIGCGNMGKKYIQDLKASGYVDRIVGYDPCSQQREKMIEEFQIEVRDNLESMWNERDLKLVCIVSPGRTHAELATEAMRRGKSVLLEKPMGLTVEELEHVLAVQQQTGAFLQVGFEARYSTLYILVKKIIDSGEIGQVRHINLNYHCTPYEYEEGSGRNWKFTKNESGGIFQEKLCHYVDLTRWWNGGRVVRSFTTAAPNTIPYYSIPDNVQCTYEFDNGTVCHLTFLMQASDSGNVNLMNAEWDLAEQATSGYKLSYVIVGTEGTIETTVFHRELRVFYHPGKPGHGPTQKMVRVERWDRDQDYFYIHNSTSENDDVSRRVAQGLGPAVPPEDAAESMRLSIEFENAIIDGTWVVRDRR